MERAQRILKKFSKILKEQGAGPLFTTFKGYVESEKTSQIPPAYGEKQNPV